EPRRLRRAAPPPSAFHHYLAALYALVLRRPYPLLLARLRRVRPLWALSVRRHPRKQKELGGSAALADTGAARTGHSDLDISRAVRRPISGIGDLQHRRFDRSEFRLRSPYAEQTVGTINGSDHASDRHHLSSVLPEDAASGWRNAQ